MQQSLWLRDMRRLLTSDVKAAAIALINVPISERGRTCSYWIDHADWAHKYMKTCGKPHPVWGRGSLLEVVEGRDAMAFNFADVDHCSAMETLLHHLVARKTRAVTEKRN